MPALALSIGGLAASLYLSLSHYRVYTDIGYSSFCALSQSINCDTVSQSPFSILLGVPVPVWGIWAYLTCVLLMLVAWLERRKQKDGWALLQVLAFLFTIYSVALAIISTFYVKSYCAMCILTYAINLLLLFYTWMIRKRFQLRSLKTGLVRDTWMLWCHKPARWVGGFLILVAITGMIVFPPYWSNALELPSDAVATGMTEDGHPWIGAKKPLLEIEEYTDYLCFQCRKMHIYLRRLVIQHPDRIRLIHRHFPMDHTINPLVKEPFHIGSAQMAILAIFANEEGKFWQMNDALFDYDTHKGEFNLQALADKTGVSLSGIQKALSERTDLQMMLAKDIWAGMKLGISGTPAFVIDGNVYLAQIPPEILRKIVH